MDNKPPLIKNYEIRHGNSQQTSYIKQVIQNWEVVNQLAKIQWR